MPYKTRWIDPAIALEYKGITVYHTYKDDDIDNYIHPFHYTTNPKYSEDSGKKFDIRKLWAWKKYGTEKHTKAEAIKILKAEIDANHDDFNANEDFWAYIRDNWWQLDIKL